MPDWRRWLASLAPRWLRMRQAARLTATDRVPARTAHQPEHKHPLVPGWGEIDANTRARLMRYARYEAIYNPLAAAIVQTWAASCIGPSGPTLELGDQPSANRVEQAWYDWSESVGLVDQLRLGIETLVRDGEVFWILTGSLLSEVQLGLQPIEAEMVGNLPHEVNSERRIDGIEYDQDWTPVAYTVLDQHPAEGAVTARVVKARSVIHLYRRYRPSQLRGVTWLAPVLEHLGALRRFLAASLASAEVAAEVGGVLWADTGGVPPVELDAMDTVQLPRGGFLTLPAGWRLQQITLANSGQYSDYMQTVVRDIARGVGIPPMLVLGASDYNMASARLDLQLWHRSLDALRGLIERLVLRRIWEVWLDEAVMVMNAPANLVPRWRWPTYAVADPLKEAEAAKLRLETGISTFAAECAANGLDWREVFAQRASEQEVLRELGILDGQENSEGLGSSDSE